LAKESPGFWLKGVWLGHCFGCARDVASLVVGTGMGWHQSLGSTSTERQKEEGWKGITCHTRVPVLCKRTKPFRQVPYHADSDLGTSPAGNGFN